eukprot:augustus_masked-scaffold_12-processed-gene-3.0-mRNA-1 protein AED:0.49 eAED:0.50 QI:0/-1/0/1/-1/1/1/0/293
MQTRSLAFKQGFSIKDKVCIVTGGASGIGEAYAEAFCKSEAKAVVISDLNSSRGKKVAETLQERYKTTKVSFTVCDVSKRYEINNLISETRRIHSQVDLFAANAGIAGPQTGFQNWKEEEFNKMLSINTMQIMYAASILTPYFLECKSGCFLITASAAGLMTQLDNINYALTKAAAVSIAEFLAIQYGERGINTVCFCPQAVKSGMTMKDGKPLGGPAFADGVLESDFVAGKVVDAIQEGRFLVVEPEERMKLYLKRKSGDYDKWVSGMQKFRDRLAEVQPINETYPVPMSKI